jgi:hypothetical protein
VHLACAGASCVRAWVRLSAFVCLRARVRRMCASVRGWMWLRVSARGCACCIRECAWVCVSFVSVRARSLPLLVDIHVELRLLRRDNLKANKPAAVRRGSFLALTWPAGTPSTSKA